MVHTRLGYWIEEAGEVEPQPPLSGELEADVLVVGGGYTGMWTAWYARQLQPEARVVLLESEPVCGHGPSGRNGGFCNAMWFSLASMRARWGDEPALAVAHAAEAAVARIGAFCEEHGVDAWFRPAGYVQVSTAPAHDGAWERAVRACRELGVPEMLQPLSAAEVAERCQSPAFRAGAVSPTSATVQPARLALGLREQLLAAGVRGLRVLAGALLPRKTATASWRRPPEGSVRAGRGVLAIGSAAKGRHGPLRDRLTVASSHIVLTEPVPDVLEEIGWTGADCITDSRALLALLPHHPGRPHRLRLGRRPDRDGRPHQGPRRGRRRRGRRRDRRPLRILPRPPRPPHHPRLGRPDRRLPDPPPGGPHTRPRQRLGGRRLHRQRRRPEQHGRPHPRLPRPRPQTTSTPASPSSTTRPPASPRSPSTGSAARRSASASSRRRRRSWRTAGHRSSPQLWLRSPS